jgi:pimeloyl-ACP methyl ester carboxylesterase
LIGTLIGVLLWIGLKFKEPALDEVEEAGFEEKVCTINGTTINYVEGPDNGPPLLLIHGQLVLWESYQRVLPDLSHHFHVFAPDCHGHGKSSKRPDQYNVQAMGRDFAAFIEDVVGTPAIVSGNSSGGLLALWLAAHAPEHVLGIVLEDPPLFSSEYPRIKETFAWDTMATAHEFLQTSEDDFLDYYLLNSRLMSLLKGIRDVIYQWVQFYKRVRPNAPVQVFFLPLSLRLLFKGMTMYDPHFGEAFYDGSWHKDFDHAEALSSVACPAVLIHAKWSYDENGVLMGAMDADDASRANALMRHSKLEKVKAGHSVHIGKPDTFTRVMLDFAHNLRVS